jgi:hypothetical protein
MVRFNKTLADFAVTFFEIKIASLTPCAVEFFSLLMADGASHLSAGLTAAILVLTYASQYSRSAVSKLRDRLLRPDRWFISNTAQSALALANAETKIASLWGVRDEYQSSRRYFSALYALKSSPLDNAKLRERAALSRWTLSRFMRGKNVRKEIVARIAGTLRSRKAG